MGASNVCQRCSTHGFDRLAAAFLICKSRPVPAAQCGQHLRGERDRRIQARQGRVLRGQLEDVPGSLELSSCAECGQSRLAQRAGRTREHAAFDHRKKLRQARDGEVSEVADRHFRPLAEKCVRAILYQQQTCLVAERANRRERHWQPEEVHGEQRLAVRAQVRTDPIEIRQTCTSDRIEEHRCAAGFDRRRHGRTVVVRQQHTRACTDACLSERERQRAARAAREHELLRIEHARERTGRCLADSPLQQRLARHPRGFSTTLH